MSNVVRIARGTDAVRQTLTLESGRLFYTTDRKELWMMDGTTPGGIPVNQVKGSSNIRYVSVLGYTANGSRTPEAGRLDRPYPTVALAATGAPAGTQIYILDGAFEGGVINLTNSVIISNGQYNLTGTINTSGVCNIQGVIFGGTLNVTGTLNVSQCEARGNINIASAGILQGQMDIKDASAPYPTLTVITGTVELFPYTQELFSTELNVSAGSTVTLHGSCRRLIDINASTLRIDGSVYCDYAACVTTSSTVEVRQGFLLGAQTLTIAGGTVTTGGMAGNIVISATGGFRARASSLFPVAAVLGNITVNAAATSSQIRINGNIIGSIVCEGANSFIGLTGGYSQVLANTNYNIVLENGGTAVQLNNFSVANSNTLGFLSCFDIDDAAGGYSIVLNNVVLYTLAGGADSIFNVGGTPPMNVLVYQAVSNVTIGADVTQVLGTIGVSSSVRIPTLY